MSRSLCFLRNTYKSKDEFSHALGKIGKFSKVMQRLDSFLGLQNFLELSQLPVDKVFYCLKDIPILSCTHPVEGLGTRLPASYKRQ